jgi:cysteine-S-conjugate beta-lyase
MYNFDEIIKRENTGCLKFDDRQNRFGRKDVLPMWVADMDFRTPDVVKETFTKIIEHGIYGYHLCTNEQYQSVINWHARRHNFKFSKSDLFFTPGVVPAISYLIQAFTHPGDKIIIQPPVYYPFFHVTERNNRSLVINQLIEDGNKYYIDFDDLEKKAKDAKMIIFCSPHNPVGRVWQKHELERLAEICLKNNVLMISDEIHCDLVLQGKHISLATLAPEVEKQTITCHSPSKTFNLASLATAYVMITNPEHHKTFRNYFSNLHVDGLNVFGYASMEAVYNHGEDWLHQVLEYINANVKTLNEFLQSEIPSVRMFQPEATYLAWLDFRKLGLTKTELRKLIIEKAGLGLNDGPMFGPGGEGFQRINLACPRATLNSAMEKLRSILK